MHNSLLLLGHVELVLVPNGTTQMGAKLLLLAPVAVGRRLDGAGLDGRVVEAALLLLLLLLLHQLRLLNVVVKLLLLLLLLVLVAGCWLLIPALVLGGRKWPLV